MTTLASVALTASPAMADVWGIAPRVTLSTRYDQNVQLAADQPSGQVGAAASVGARVVRYGNTTDWSLDPQFVFVRYPKQPNLNRDEIQVNGAVVTRFELGEWANIASYTRDTTITSERGASGLTETNLPHEHISVAMTPSFHFAPQWNTGATASWSTDRYKDGQAIGLVDYDYASLGGQLQYSPTERTAVSVDASVGRLSVPTTHNTTDQYAANLRIERSLTELWRLSLSGGPLRVASDVLTENGLGYAVKLNRQSETINILVSASRDVVPNGRGILSKRDQANAVISRNWSSRFATDLSAQWLRNRNAVPTLGLQFGEVSYGGVDAALRWQAAPTTSISFSVGWSRQDQDSIIKSADAYRAALSLVWQGLERGH